MTENQSESNSPPVNPAAGSKNIDLEVSVSDTANNINSHASVQHTTAKGNYGDPKVKGKMSSNQIEAEDVPQSTVRHVLGASSPEQSHGNLERRSIITTRRKPVPTVHSPYEIKIQDMDGSANSKDDDDEPGLVPSRISFLSQPSNLERFWTKASSQGLGQQPHSNEDRAASFNPVLTTVEASEKEEHTEPSFQVFNVAAQPSGKSIAFSTREAVIESTEEALHKEKPKQPSSNKDDMRLRFHYHPVAKILATASSYGQAKSVYIVKRIAEDNHPEGYFIRKEYSFRADGQGSAQISEARWRHRKEIEILDSLQHPHILKLEDRGTWSDDRYFTAYLITEYCLGGDMSKFTGLGNGETSSLPLEEWWSVFYQLASALFYCHDGIIVTHDRIEYTTGSHKHEPILHRDIKPENVTMQRLADDNIRDSRVRTVLNECIKGEARNRPNALEILLFTGPNERRTRTYVHPGKIAVETGDIRLFQILVDKGMNLYPHVDDCSTPLHWAAANGKLEMARFLLDGEIRIDPENQVDRTGVFDTLQLETPKPEPEPVVKKIDATWAKVIRFILRVSAAVLIAAAKVGSLVLNVLLTGRSARKNAKRAETDNTYCVEVKFSALDRTSRGVTPLRLAAENGHEEMFLLLRDSICKTRFEWKWNIKRRVADYWHLLCVDQARPWWTWKLFWEQDNFTFASKRLQNTTFVALFLHFAQLAITAWAFNLGMIQDNGSPALLKQVGSRVYNLSKGSRIRAVIGKTGFSQGGTLSKFFLMDEESVFRQHTWRTADDAKDWEGQMGKTMARFFWRQNNVPSPEQGSRFWRYLVPPPRPFDPYDFNNKSYRKPIRPETWSGWRGCIEGPVALFWWCYMTISIRLHEHQNQQSILTDSSAAQVEHVQEKATASSAPHQRQTPISGQQTGVVVQQQRIWMQEIARSPEISDQYTPSLQPRSLQQPSRAYVRD
ncbi:hypothetical protein FH972_022615 [Carpinus fangiana]|uniref:non-specific serine/threonine protein kinase n=1 Tax=Carpinus fangiana TaxID=176857 RepID=A0A5N6KTB4_9ROSI|nr:hypothetical protein FH972_022615 [Carpinus fangiana]